MRKLYELVPGWDKRQKDRLYQALKETNRDLVEELEGGHFVDRHREQLIQRVSEVDGVLKLLCGHTLTPEQYRSISTGRSNVEKMQKLYELVPSWGREHKDWLYGVLWRTNRALVDEFAGVDTRAQKPSTSTSPGATQEHFVERHREQLIQRASSVDTILGVLLGGIMPPLPPPSFRQGRAEMQAQDLKRRRDMSDESLPFLALRATSKSLTKEPEGEHFVERHREQLIQRASSVDTILGVLRRSHYTLDAMPPSVGLKRTNIRLRDMPSGAGQGTGRELSVDSRDDPTTAGFRRFPPLPHDSMRNQGPKAHTVFPGEGSQVTGQAHHSLAPTGHSGHMEVLHDQISAEELTSASGFTNKETESHSSSAAGIKAARGETSRSQSPTACLRGQHKCNWCSREEEEDLPEEIKPEIIQDVDGNQEMYRVHFSRAGWFRCPETELEFEVRAAVTIRYGYGSWRQHLTESQQEQWMVAGPLFDIRVEPTEAVAAIHLPHFLCLRDADKSWMHIAHFIDEGMILENPTQVRLFHAVLENPSFSLIGVFWRRESSVQRIPIHSIVLLYQAQKRVNLTLHLYLIPDDGSRVKAVDVYEEKCRSWFVSKSHFTSKPLCFGSRCIVSSPSEITVTPKELPFLDKPADALQPFTEIHTKDVKEELELSLVEKNDEKPIWAAVIRPEDLMPSVSSTKMRTDTHFVDQHREQLIQRVTAVDSILDSLHGLVLDTEQYQRVRAERTNPDKMRKLYELVPSWNSDCKEKLYQVLKDKHRHLVEELSGNR